MQALIVAIAVMRAGGATESGDGHEHSHSHGHSMRQFACHESASSLLLDIGGEGSHSEAWNLNPSCVRTLGPRRGLPIPKLILGRAKTIPFPNQSAL